MDYWTTIADERRALADLLDELDPGQWASQSLCGAWTVRDVAAHLVFAAQGGLGKFLLAAVKSRGNFHRASEAITAVEARNPTAQIVADLRRFADRQVAPPGMGPQAPLTDILVHTQDIRIPLGLDDDRPVEPWRGALDFLMTSKARRGFLPKPIPALHYVATDLDWSHGDGETVDGPAKALALSLLGRSARATELTGPGAATLTRWLVR